MGNCGEELSLYICFLADNFENKRFPKLILRLKRLMQTEGKRNEKNWLPNIIITMNPLIKIKIYI